MPEEQPVFLVSIIFRIPIHVGKFTVFFYGECNVILRACANSEYQATLMGEWPGDEASWRGGPSESPHWLQWC